MSHADTPIPRLFDSHCHVDASDFDADRTEMLERAKAAGVEGLILVAAGGSLKEVSATVAFAAQYPNMHATVGVHPHHAANLDTNWWTDLSDLAERPEVVAIGETGLDFHYDSSPRETQLRWFIRHIDLAIKLGKPLICHIRDAHSQATEILRTYAAGRCETIIHCFTGSPEEAQGYADMGFYVSFSGVVTFRGKSALPIRDSIARIPQDHLLIETDCPYLAPVPRRGKRNEPAFLIHTAQVVADAIGLELTELAAITARNTRVVFGLTSS